MEFASIVEALLFASQEPLSVADMQRAIREAVREAVEVAKEAGREADEAKSALKDVTEEQIRSALDTLADHYDKDGRAFTIVERSTGWRICARGEYGEWCRALYPGKKPTRLSQPAVETLAIIAYRQPITKSAIEAVRGVSVDAMVQQLLDRGFVRIDGRADLPGRPLLYCTTDMFLDHFGVRTLDDLPNAAELRRVKLPTPEEAQVPPEGGPPAAEGSDAEAVKAAEAEQELTLGFEAHPEG
jgi:segregation and condensation protein B